MTQREREFYETLAIALIEAAAYVAVRLLCKGSRDHHAPYRQVVDRFQRQGIAARKTKEAA